MSRLPFFLLLFLWMPARAQSYFQQRVDTKIEVRLDDKAHVLHGFETIQYTNNSPDTLRYIYIHLWPNAYASDRTKFSGQQALNRSTAFYFSKPSERGSIDSLDFRVGGKTATAFSADGLPDIARLDLPEPLPPGVSAEIATPFRVKIPKVFSRLGHTGQAYFISQWFPKPAVYDRKGWHPLPYLDQGEFYSEIGSYNVQITLPENYVVMATGNLTDAGENRWLDSLAALPYGDTTRPTKGVAAWRKKVNAVPKSSNDTKTIHYHEDNVHDFAWFADKRFVVRKDTVQVPAGSGIEAHTVTIWTGVLPSERGPWRRATEYIRKTITALSNDVGPYPYNTVKAVEGDLKAGGGMEYPTITVIDRAASQIAFMETIVHEVGHNWFYGILATNERDHPWMDEGFNSFYDQQIVNSIKAPKMKKGTRPGRIEDVLYYNAAADRTDQPLSTSSAGYAKIAYGLDAYYKTALLLGWLEGYMGRDTFRNAMRAYYDQWHFRHPYPNDIERVFSKQTSKPIGWLFRDAISSAKGIDFAVQRVRKSGDITTILLRNRGDFAAPVRINAYLRDSLVDSAWTAPFARDTAMSIRNSSAAQWRVGSEVPDYYGHNNLYRAGGLFHRAPFRIKAGAGTGRREAPTLFVLPALGYNVYDGFQAGLLFHNLSVPQSRFRFAVAPLYALRSKAATGAASIGYWMYPNAVFREIVAALDVKTFHYDSTSFNSPDVLRARYFKISPSLTFTLRNASPLSTVTRTVLLKGYAIGEDNFSFTLDPSDSLYKPSQHLNGGSFYGLARYTHLNERTFNPFSYALEGQGSGDFLKISGEGRLRIDYNKPGKALHLRAFGGKYVPLRNGFGTNTGEARTWLTSTFTAANDYLYDGTYFGRSEREGLASRQVSIQEGGGKIATPLYAFPLGRSDDWLAGINIKTDLPLISLPVRLYFDASTYAGAQRVSPSGSRFLYSGGIEIHALRDVLLLNIPLLMSADYRDYLKSMYPGEEFANSISFSVQLQNISWLRAASGVLKYLLN